MALTHAMRHKETGLVGAVQYWAGCSPSRRDQLLWSFGCPGHGKGPWDGLGAVLKRALRDNTINNKIRSDSSKLRTRTDVLQVD